MVTNHYTHTSHMTFSCNIFCFFDFEMFSYFTVKMLLVLYSETYF